MCRWIAYSGSPILLDSLLYKPAHSLIDQSLNAKLGPHTTNGDGFGVGWYGEGDIPVVYKGVDPIWNDRNMRELAPQVRSHLMFAHIRAATGTPVQHSNCHPFRHGKWLWMHNGQIAGFREIKREMILAIDEALYPDIEGSTDTEVFFFLALSFGLEQDPPGAVERAVGFIEEAAERRGIEHPMRMSLAVSDGRHLWAFRYASIGEPPSLFYSTRTETLRKQYPEIAFMQHLSDDSQLVVSEPLGELEGAWNEVPASHYGVIHQGQHELVPFTPQTA
ncbi:MAG TPA: class II glutamine amidotransferase [Allosphingosinicella sp.]|jgi:glutamine amidotransferase